MSTRTNKTTATYDDQSWDDVISSTKVVATRSEALACVTLPGASGNNKKAFIWKSIKKFCRWHLPLLALAFLTLQAIRMIVMLTFWLLAFDSKKEEGTNNILTPAATLWLVIHLMMRDFLWTLGLSSSLQSFSNDKGGMTTFMMTTTCCRMAFALLGRFILVTMVLIILRIIQRLSWRTTELGTFPNVKDDARYQDEQLLTKAWYMAFQNQGYKEPTQYSDYKDGVGGGTVVMQPCPGFCGIATVNSTLRSFGGCTGQENNNAPYLSLHTHPRYVTLEEMCKLVQEKVISTRTAINGSTCNNSSEWERGGGGRVDSMQVIGGGSNGLKCLEQFKAALRQLSHPTQPARIMAIYHRSPLFFCSKDRSMTSKLACFPSVHWSPVLAYLEEEDVVLVMDVNHTYGNKGYLISTQRFFDSVNTRDIFNGNYHGLILLRPPPKNGASLPLVTSPRDLSVVFGKIKRAYYRHQAAGRKATAAAILVSNEDGFNPLKDNEQGEKSIRLVTIGNDTSSTSDEPGEVSAVISAHPVFFANEIFLDTPGRVPSPESVRTMINVFAKLRVPPRVAVRGFDSSSTAASDVHRILTAAGMVQLIKPTKVAFLNLEPTPRNAKTSTEKLPQGYYIQEISFHPDKKGQQSPAVEDLGKLIVESYKFPNIFRRGQTPSDFSRQAYQTFEHGGKELRHFGCYERESGTLASCVALFRCDNSSTGYKYNDGTTTTTRPDVAAVYNVCTSPNHRHKGLGKAMTMHALEVAKTMGCKQVVLEASKAGQPLYESMGFVVMEDPAGAVYVSLSSATDDFKWKNGFRLLELYYRVKNGGMWYYADALRELVTKRR